LQKYLKLQIAEPNPGLLTLTLWLSASSLGLCCLVVRSFALRKSLKLISVSALIVEKREVTLGACPEVLDYAARLAPSSHAALFYDNDQVAASVIAAYIKGGVDRREATYFVCSSRGLYQHFLELGGVNLNELEGSGSLSNVSAGEFYLESGRLSGRLALENAKLFLKIANEAGFNSARLISLIDFNSLPSSIAPKEIVEYERLVGPVCPLRVSAICCYDENRMLEVGGNDFFIDILQAHGHALFKGFASPE
jgi:hypothetical protein